MMKHYYFGRGLIPIDVGALPLIIFFSLMVFYPFPYKNITDLILIKLLFGILLVINIWNYFNFVSEVKLDNDFLYIRKIRKFYKIPWSNLQHVRIYILYGTGGGRILWFREKNSPSLWRSFCLIAITQLEKYELFLDFLSELKKKRVPVKGKDIYKIKDKRYYQNLNKVKKFM